MAAAIRLNEQHSCSFNHLVGAGEQGWRDFEAQRLVAPTAESLPAPKIFLQKRLLHKRLPPLWAEPPVFDAMLENATRICQAKFGTLYLREGDTFRAAALHNAPPAFADIRKREPVRPGPRTVLSRVLTTKQAVRRPPLLPCGGEP